MANTASSAYGPSVWSLPAASGGAAEPLCRVLGRGCDSYVWARSPGRFDWFRSHRRKPPPQPDYRSLGPRRLDGRRRGDDTEGRLRGESDLLSPIGPNRLECLRPRLVPCQAHAFRIGIGPFPYAYPESPPKESLALPNAPTQAVTEVPTKRTLHTTSIKPKKMTTV